MSNGIEIRMHGRGGQGTVTLALLLVDAAARGGWFTLGFPAFGTERTGAPVAAFVRLGRSPIRDRSEVRRPSVVLVQDPTLLRTVDVLEGTAEDAMVIVNATPATSKLPRAIVVPATALALELLGKPITSTAMLGALAGATGIVGIDHVAAAIADRFPGAAGERNVAVACAAFEIVAREVRT